MDAPRSLLARIDYCPLPGRPRLRWPNDARLAFWVIPNVEYYQYTPSGVRVGRSGFPAPDVPAYASRDYGNRVGFWRMLEVLDRHRIRCTVNINLAVLEHFPEIRDAMLARDWDFCFHGFYNDLPEPRGLSEAEERAWYQRVAYAMPKGWLSPEQSESTRTPGLLAELGVEYLCDWANDDQPYLIGRGGRALVSLPLMQEISDVNLHWNRGVTMVQWAALVCEAFDTLYREGLDSGRLFVLPLHPWCIGQPFRVKYLDHVLTHVKKHDEVWTTTGGEIAAWYRRSHDH